MRRLTIVLVAVVLSGCAYNVGPYEGVRGSGNVKSESRDVQGFNRVEVIGVATVRITQGTTESLTVRAEDNLLSRFRSEVEGA